MDPSCSPVPTEILRNRPLQLLDCLALPWDPQPGAYLNLHGKTYAVLERRHRYRYTAGQYQLYKIVLFVQETNCSSEMSLIEGQWVIGDASCIYNARSILMRCAVNPDGPCHACPCYKSTEEEE